MDATRGASQAYAPPPGFLEKTKIGKKKEIYQILI
jgi:hypothetical protein